jgi:hypothetical protein
MQNVTFATANAFGARSTPFTERFALSCLNRLQLRDSRQMVDLQDPAGSLQLVGTLANPLARVGVRSPAA